MREKQIPVDNVEFKEPISAFAWEPTGSKFAVIWGETPRINVSFYNVKAEAKVYWRLSLGIYNNMISI